LRQPLPYGRGSDDAVDLSDGERVSNGAVGCRMDGGVVEWGGGLLRDVGWVAGLSNGAAGCSGMSDEWRVVE
jgi:hypothetical protein